jgi:hypothetical protein
LQFLSALVVSHGEAEIPELPQTMGAEDCQPKKCNQEGDGRALQPLENKHTLENGAVPC